jgi:hypothetical protein
MSEEAETAAEVADTAETLDNDQVRTLHAMGGDVAS